MTYQPNRLKQIFHNTRRFLAKHHLSSKKAIQIGITGSQGKTNTTYVVTSVLEALGETVVTDTNLDTTYNVPITGLKVKNTTRYLVWELGIDRPGEMSSHLEIAKPQIGVITGISPVHTDAEHMGSLKRLIEEKRKLIEALPEHGYAILNWDDENVRAMAPFTKAKVMKFGTSTDCDVWVDPNTIVSSLKGISFEIHDGKITIPIQSGLIGLQHMYNIMAAYLIFKLVSTDNVSLFQKAVKKLIPLKGRMSIEAGPRKTTILNDALRANPTSTRFGLRTLVSLQEGSSKKIAVLAEMGEIDKTEEEHTKLGQFISTLQLDCVVCIGPLQKYVYEAAVKEGFKKDNIFWVADVFEAARVLNPIVKENDILYMKGSLLRHVERVLLLLQGEEVKCTVTVCPFYRHCSNCEYLHIGYQNVSHQGEAH